MNEIKELMQEIQAFSEERDWEQFHTPVNLAKSIAIEAGELLECFQWNDNANLEDVEEELADVFNYGFQLATKLNLDPAEIIRKKIKKNAAKYPVEKSKGRSDKYDMRVVVCSKCGNEIAISPSQNEAILDQFREEVRQEAKAEQEAAVKIAVDTALDKARIKFYQQETKAAQDRAASEQTIAELQHKIELAEHEKKTAIQQALTEAEAEKNRLAAELHHCKEAANMDMQAKAAQAEKKIRDIEAKNQQEKSRIIAAADAEIAKKDQQIATMAEQAKAANSEKQLAIKNAQEKMNAELQKREAEILVLKGQMETQIQAAKLQGTMLKEQYEAALRLKDEELQRVRDFKAKLSTKALGESLEKFCENEFNKIRTTAFPNASFEKDNNAASGSKGDFIYRETIDGVEILSAMFEMKTEADETATKHKNEDFFAKLDKDRREKQCEYAILVTTLEADNEFYNSGIQDVSFRYPKMYVVRPSQFITIISLLRNAALNSVEYQKELAAIKTQQLDLTNFEANMDSFKDAFGRNYRLASDKLKAAVDGIDKSIAALQKTKDNLIASDNQLRLANDKAEDLSIKKLTRGAPSVAAKLASIKATVPGAKADAPGDTVNAGDSAMPESDEDKSA